MPNGGLRARMDALSGGPGRRQREMLRRLEELDRLDLRNPDPEQVLWPDGRSSRHDPRAWQPTSSPAAVSESWWHRRGAAVIVVTMMLLVAWHFAPQATTWVERLRPLSTTSARLPGPAAPTPPVRPSPPVVIAMTPDPSQFAFMLTQGDGRTPVTYDPCREIHFVVRDAPGAGPQGRELVRQAVAEVSAASGLRFVDDGDTDETPTDRRTVYDPNRYPDGRAPVLIAWSNASEQPQLKGRVFGLGGSTPMPDSRGHLTYMSGTVWLDTPDLVPYLTKPGGSAKVRAVIMHELGHVLGAEHVSDPREVMAPANTGQVTWGPGDRYALSVLGNGECVPRL